MNLTDYNHNSNSNPHQQYSDFTYSTYNPTMFSSGWNLIIDKTFEYTIGSGSQTEPMALTFVGLMYSNALAYNQNIFQISIIMHIWDKGYICNVDNLPVLQYNNDVDYIRAVVNKISEGKYNLKVYVKNFEGYGRVFIRPQLLDTTYWIDSNVPIFANKRLNLKDRCDDLFSICGVNQDIESLPSGDLIKSPRI